MAWTRQLHRRASRLAPTTLTQQEQETLLQVTRSSIRDHMLISLALGTGLRLQELLGLDVRDIAPDGATVRTRIPLRPSITKGARGGEAFLPQRLVKKLRRYLASRSKREGPLGIHVPLFVSQHGNRLSKRRAQQIVHAWQERAGFDRRYGFHSLRHSAITNLYRSTKDILLTQRFARHAHLATTTTYTHAGDEELAKGVQRLLC